MVNIQIGIDMNVPKKMIAFIWIWIIIFTGCTGAKTQEKNGQQNSRSPGNHNLTIQVDQTKRHYVAYVPTAYNEHRQWPVVIVFHGGGGKASSTMWDTGWPTKANQAGFIAIFPEGTPPDPSKPGNFRTNPQTWNDGSKRPAVRAAENKIEDEKFVSALLSDLKLRFKVNPQRIYATGFSNGASMSFRVAREFSTQLAAIAPVSGSDWMTETIPRRAVPVLYITGTKDPLNPIHGGPIRIGAKSFGVKPDSRPMIARWAKLHGCPEKATITDVETEVKKTTYCENRSPHPVLFYSLEGHGHHWPGGRLTLPAIIAGPKTTRLNATDLIWEFFKKHSNPVE